MSCKIVAHDSNRELTTKKKKSTDKNDRGVSGADWATSGLQIAPRGAIHEKPSWYSDAERGKRFVTTGWVGSVTEECEFLHIDEKKELGALKNMQVMGQVLQSQGDGYKVYWIVAEHEISSDPHGQQPLAVAQKVHSVAESGHAWRRKFCQRKLCRSLQSYRDWHQDQVGESTM